MTSKNITSKFITVLKAPNTKGVFQEIYYFPETDTFYLSVEKNVVGMSHRSTKGEIKTYWQAFDMVDRLSDRLLKLFEY